MGLTQRLGTIPLAIQTDSSNNVGIGGAANASYKLAVTGASLFSSTLTANGTLVAGLANGNIRLKGSTDGFLGVGESDGKLYLSDWNTATKGLVINLSSGNVGIGTSSPVTKLEVNDANGIPLRFGDITAAPSSQTAGYIGMSTSAFSGNNGDLVLYPRTSATSKILLMGGNVGIGTSSPQSILHLESSSGNGVATRFVSTSANGRSYAIGSNFVTGTGEFAIYDYTAGAERMRITSGGITFLTADGIDQLRIRNASDNNRQLLIGYDYANNYASIQSVQQTIAYRALYLNKDGGAVYAGSVRLDILSDERVKDNIQNIDGALNKVLSITGKKFHLKDEEEGKLRYGFIAQELEGILDEFVIQTDMTFKKDDLEVENVKSIENWASSWSALLVEAIKEQQEIINQLSAKVTALENK